MSTDSSVDRILRPLTNTTKGHYVLLAIFGLGTLWMLFAWVLQIRGGVTEMTALGDWGVSGGIPWGLYVGAFVWWIGIAHGALAISAAIRVLKRDRFRVIARIAEVLAVVALAMAALNIVFKLGRPDRIFNTLSQWPQTVHHSPLAWDIAGVTLFLVLAVTYLVLNLRDSVYAHRDRLPSWLSPIYGAILVGYRPEESEKMDRITWWMAVAILALVPMLSGGIIPWLFGLISAQPSWFGAAAGPAMLVEALTAALATVLVVAIAFRYAYGWEDLIGTDVIRDLAKLLTIFVIAMSWFVVHDVLTGLYHAPVHVEGITGTVLAMPFFWLTVAGIGISGVYLIASWLFPRFFNVGGVLVASVVVGITVLNNKVMFIVQGLMFPTEPPLANLYPMGTYFPNWIEWSLVLGTVALAGLAFVVIAKVIPMIELESLEGDTTEHETYVTQEQRDEHTPTDTEAH